MQPTLALTTLAGRAEAFAAAARSPRTRLAYASDWRDFLAFCARQQLAPALPVDPATVALYLTDLAARAKASTVTRRAAALSQIHQLAGHSSPTELPALRKLLAGIRRSLGTAPAVKRPLLASDVAAIVRQLPATRIGLRDRALLLVGFAGAFRRSELAALNWEDLEEQPQGLAVTIRRSKTDAEGQGRKVGLPRGREACPVAALAAWREECGATLGGATSGPVFRRVDRHGRLLARLSGQAVALVVKRRAAAIGLEASEFSGHSLRAGLATSAALAGKSERAILLQTGHRSTAMLRRYIRNGSLFQDNAAEGIGL